MLPTTGELLEIETETESSDCSSSSPTGTTSSLPALSGPLWVFRVKYVVRVHAFWPLKMKYVLGH